MTRDEFTPDEIGLTRLLEKLGKEHPRYIDALVLEARLRHDIKQARLYPNDATGKTALVRTLKNLNQLALEELGISFNELCEEDSGPRKRTSTLAGCTARIGSWMFQAKVIVIAVVLLVIGVGLYGTVGRPVLEGWAVAWSLVPPKAPAVTPSGPEITVKAGKATTIRASAKGADRYEWELLGEGQISSSEAPAILYAAPNELGLAVLSVTAHNDRGPSSPTALILNISCPTMADAEGTASPAVAISSITFIVNGDEQIAHDFGSLQVSSSDRLEVKEVTICVDSFKDMGGAVFVEFDPVDQGGKVIAPEVRGTRSVAVIKGFTTIPGPDCTWTVGENWRHISVVTVHWPPGGGTQNRHCEDGGCEVDDRMIVPIE